MGITLTRSSNSAEATKHSDAPTHTRAQQTELDETSFREPIEQEKSKRVAINESSSAKLDALHQNVHEFIENLDLSFPRHNSEEVYHTDCKVDQGKVTFSTASLISAYRQSRS